MSEATNLLNRLGLPKHRYITLPEYQNLGTKDANTLYFIKGTSLIYRGAAPYGSTIKTVAVLPAVAEATAGLHYFVTDGKEAGIYTLNAAGDAFVNITVTKKYVDGVAADFVNNVIYDAANARLTFKKPGGGDVVINLPKDNFLSAASFNAETNTLSLKLADGSKVDVPLSELMNVYTGGVSSTAKASVSAEGEITVDMQVSKENGNSLAIKADGLYVKVPPIAPALNETVTDAQTVGAKTLYDILSALAWDETGV